MSDLTWLKDLAAEDRLRNLPVSELPLAARAKTVARHAGVKTAGELIEVEEFYLLRQPNCGSQTLHRLRDMRECLSILLN